MAEKWAFQTVLQRAASWGKSTGAKMGGRRVGRWADESVGQTADESVGQTADE
jgi:hypothetical protein